MGYDVAFEELLEELGESIANLTKADIKKILDDVSQWEDYMFSDYRSHRKADVVDPRPYL